MLHLLLVRRRTIHQRLSTYRQGRTGQYLHHQVQHDRDRAATLPSHAQLLTETTLLIVRLVVNRQLHVQHIRQGTYQRKNLLLTPVLGHGIHIIGFIIKGITYLQLIREF